MGVKEWISELWRTVLYMFGFGVILVVFGFALLGHDRRFYPPDYNPLNWRVLAAFLTMIISSGILGYLMARWELRSTRKHELTEVDLTSAFMTGIQLNIPFSFFIPVLWAVNTDLPLALGVIMVAVGIFLTTIMAVAMSIRLANKHGFSTFWGPVPLPFN